MRWKAFFTLRPEAVGITKETYGFNTTSVPPVCQELREFEEGMIDIASKVRFEKVNSTFLDKWLVFG